MVEKYLRSVCRAAKDRLAEMRRLMAEHHGRGLMAVHHSEGYHILVVPETLKVKEGRLVIPCSAYLDYILGGASQADKLTLLQGPLVLDAVNTHLLFYPGGSTRQLVYVHIGDPAFIAWSKQLGSLGRYPEVPRVAARLGHTIREEDLAVYRDEFVRSIERQARGCAGSAADAAEKLYTGSYRDSKAKEQLHLKLKMAHDEIGQILQEATAAGLDPTIIEGHRTFFRERLATYD